MSHHINIVRIKAVARSLRELNEEVVFIGGAAVSLYIEHPERINLRPTDDVDVIIELANRGKYYLMQQRLREIGFAEDVESGIICRWKIKGFTVDIMPTNSEIIGFSNPWYPPGIAHKEIKIIDGIKIHILPITYFFGTKFEALFKRGGGIDWRWSSDFEDIVKLCRECNPKKLSSEIKDNKLRLYLLNSFKKLLEKEPYFFEACSAHLTLPFYKEEDISIIIDKIKLIISNFGYTH